MKMLVIDTRDNTRLFGEIKSFTNDEEQFLNCEKTDLVQVGEGDLKTVLPVNAVRVLANVNARPADAIDCDAVAQPVVAVTDTSTDTTTASPAVDVTANSADTQSSDTTSAAATSPAQ